MPRPSALDHHRNAGTPASTNESAARILDQFASELACDESPPSRRIAAYRQAAEALRQSPLSIDELWRTGGDRGLTRIRGVTPAIARVVGDLIATKRIPLRGSPHDTSGSKR